MLIMNWMMNWIHLLGYRNDHGLNNICVNVEHVHCVLSRMNLQKGSGHDNVSSLFLRECADFLAEPISKIFSRSIADKMYPDRFKIGQVTPIFKSGKRANVSNYRGVNVLPNLAKVFERLVSNQLKLIIAPRISTQNPIHWNSQLVYMMRMNKMHNLMFCIRT